MKTQSIIHILASVFFFLACKTHTYKKEVPTANFINTTNNVLNYSGCPTSTTDRFSLVFSDNGAWFGFGLGDNENIQTGFSGPFLMTQQNGVWMGPTIGELDVRIEGEPVNWKSLAANSFASHLERSFSSDNLILKQELFYVSEYTAIIQATLMNLGEKELAVSSNWRGHFFENDFTLSTSNDVVKIESSTSDFVGYFSFGENEKPELKDSGFGTSTKKQSLAPNESIKRVFYITFVPTSQAEVELVKIRKLTFEEGLNTKIQQKNEELSSLFTKCKSLNENEQLLLAKSYMTLQNNWRAAAGELKHQGLFPSYHYVWFHGFWAWDSWKHAKALAFFNPELAKDQMRAMFDFQDADGFIADCIFRDTAVEAHNYRNTKPPLATWAVVEIYEQDEDLSFLKEVYPKLKKFHRWWYLNRDHDGDGLCEYGSTDGTLVAAKWESGMDNAVRFDKSRILKNHTGAYSINQESIDLNAYLYADKLNLKQIATVLGIDDEADQFSIEADTLKRLIQAQFYDENTGWFYDTDLEGNLITSAMGCEGWIPLWANVASRSQADAVKNTMMNREKFLTKVPLQTLAADHPKFNPLDGYWRGPNWLDQSYFGVVGLKNYGFMEEAKEVQTRLINGAKGVAIKGTSIRENYHPITGEGLNAENFSWSAAHYLLLLLNE